MNGVNLSQGVCDQPAPDAVKKAAQVAIDDDHASYTNLRGTIELRRAIAEKMKAFNGVTCDPETEIVTTVGSAGGFACAVLSILNPGDEAVVFSPFYSYHVNLLKLFGAGVRFVDLNPPDWNFDRKEFERAFTDRTKMVVVCTPSNPCGKVFDTDELKYIAEVAKQRNVWIVTDEIYEYITYGKKHVSMASFPEARERTITLSGGSKTYAITGWRVGYAVGPAAIMDRMAVVNDLVYICAPAPLQHGMEAGLELPESYYKDMQADYLVKRDLLAKTLREIEFTPFVPEGSYYMLASFENGRWGSSTAAAEAILNEVGVASVPGSAFYRNPEDGDNQLRFCFAKTMADLRDACSRLSNLAVKRRSPARVG